MNYQEMAVRLPEHDRDHALELARQAAFMRQKLAETRLALAGEPIVVEGRAGARENPAYPAYEKLLRSYSATVAELRALVGADAPAQTAGPKLAKFERKLKAV